MIKRLLITTMLISGLGLSTAQAEETQASTKKAKVVTTLVGYEDKTIGNIVISGSGEDPAAKPQNIDTTTAFDILDKDNDAKLSKNEMFDDKPATRATSKRSNLVTKSGNPIRVDYYARNNTPTSVKVEDLTADGTLFESMDINNDGFVERNEFSFDIREAVKANTIAPATGSEAESSQ